MTLLEQAKARVEWMDKKLTSLTISEKHAIISLLPALLDRALKHSAECGVNHPEPMKYHYGYSPLPCDCKLAELEALVRTKLGIGGE